MLFLNTFYFKIIVFKFFLLKKETNSISGIVDTVNHNNFRINFPFGYIPEMRFNSIKLMVGVGYGVNNYYWQNITVFDSQCRTCQNGILDEKLVN